MRKNATDSAMIDALDILHMSKIDAFCLVSSDRDYTRLATRIREQGLFIMVIGRKDTPQTFVNACNVFAYAENLQNASSGKSVDSKGPVLLLKQASSLLYKPRICDLPSH